MRLSDFLTEIGRPVAYYPKLATIIGSVKASVLLCQLLYWEGKQDVEDGWIFKTIEEMREETGLSRKEQDGAIKALKSKGILRVALKGVPPKRYFTVDKEVLEEIWNSWLEAKTTKKSNLSQMGKLICPKQTEQSAPNGQINLPHADKTICPDRTNPITNINSNTNCLSETTAEITSETTAERRGVTGKKQLLFPSSTSTLPTQNNHSPPGEAHACESERSISTDVSSPARQDISSNEKTILAILGSIPGYPYDVQKDLILIRDLLADFPCLDMPEELKQWKAWLLGYDAQKKKINYRSRLRNWLSISEKYRKERASRKGPGLETGMQTGVDDDPYGDIPTRDIPYGNPQLDMVRLGLEDPYEDISTRDIPYGDPLLDNRGDPYEDIDTRDIPL